MLREILFDLVQAERALAIIQQSAPDDERGRHLAAIRAAREQLGTVLLGHRPRRAGRLGVVRVPWRRVRDPPNGRHAGRYLVPTAPAITGSGLSLWH